MQSALAALAAQVAKVRKMGLRAPAAVATKCSALRRLSRMAAGGTRAARRALRSGGGFHHAVKTRTGSMVLPLGEKGHFLWVFLLLTTFCTLFVSLF